MIKRSIPWTGQPQYPAQVDRSGNLFDPSKITCLINPGASRIVDAVTGKLYTVSSNASVVPTIQGKGIKWVEASDSYIEIASNADTILDTINCTMIVATVRTSATTTVSSTYGYDGGGGPDRVLTHLPFTDNNLYWDFGNATPGAGGGRVSVGGSAYSAAGTVSIWGFVAGSRGREIWRNGIRIASDATANFTRTSTAHPFRIGAAYLFGGASGFSVAHTCSLFLISKEQWSITALSKITDNPNLVYAPQQRNIYVGGNGSPTASQIESGTAVETSSIASATTAAITESGTALETASVAAATTANITEAGAAVETTSADIGALSSSQVESGTAADTSSIVMASTAARAETGAALETSSASNVTTASQIETGAALDSSSASIAGPTTTPYTVIMTNVSGTFPTGNVKIGGVVVGTCVGPQAADGASSAKLRAQYKNLAADAYRALIQPVPGSGGILGVWLYNNVVYVFRNAADGLSAVMYKSSSSGWTAVSLGRELSFTSGGTYHLSVGDIIVGETSGATAVVTSVSLESGSFDAGDASGRIIFASQTGTFGAETIKVGANLNIASISGDSSIITFAVPGGRFEFGNYNFGGSAGSTKMYGVDGKNRGFEFDGTTLTPIATGMVPDTPSHLHAHKNHLFYSFAGSAQHSGIGTPHTWTVISGAAELAMGDTITGFMSQPGADTTAAMAIFSRNSIKILYGTSSANWNLVSYRVEVGAIAHTIQQVGITLMLDDRGVTSLETTQNYGNFADAVLSKLVQSWIIARRSNSIASCVVRDKNQYRLFFTDGSGLYVTMDNGKLVGMLPVTLPNILTCICSAENNSGDENIFFGDSTGYVHQMDIGTSFDGASIEASLNLAFTNSKSPRVLKSYRNAVVEVAGQGYSEFSFSYDLGYSSTEINQPGSVLGALALSPVTWDSGVLWDSGAVYDGVSLLPVPFDLGGDAENISISILSSGDYFTPMRFSGVLIHYTPRRLIR